MRNISPIVESVIQATGSTTKAGREMRRHIQEVNPSAPGFHGVNRRNLLRFGSAAAATSAAATLFGGSHAEAATLAGSALTSTPSVGGVLPLSTQQPFSGLFRNRVDDTGPYIIGADTTRLFARDVNSGGLRQSTDGIGYSGHKGMPGNVEWGDCLQMLTFKENLYLLAKDSVANTVNVYRTPHVDGEGLWTWTGVHTGSPGAVGYSTSMSASANSLIWGEYGDPVGGPSVWRTTDGDTWTRTYGPDPDMRHIHAVEHDPYNAGHVWMTCGDGIGKTVQRSTDDGLTWQVVVVSAGWQSVQISFDANWVYLASDSGSHTFHVVDRATLTPYVGTPNSHRNFAVPGPLSSINDRFSTNSYMAAVDPTTGFFYACANESGADIWNGLFYTAGVGLPINILDRGSIDNCLNGRVFMWGSRVWCGLWNAPRLAT